MTNNPVPFTRKVPNPRPLTCIFCKNEPNSGEHIFAKWMRSYLRDDFDFTSHLVRDDEEALHQGPMQRSGDYRSRTSHVVCESCNNGWMSQMQEKAKSVMAPLLEGRAYPLDNNACLTIANWTTMFSMVKEYDHPKTIAIPKSDRLFFKENKRPPANWQVYLAKFGGHDKNGACWQRALGHKQHSHSPTIYNTKITIGAAGKLFFLAFSSANQNDLPFLAPRIAIECLVHGFKLAWPLSKDNFCDISDSFEFQDKHLSITEDSLAPKLATPLKQILNQKYKI